MRRSVACAAGIAGAALVGSALTPGIQAAATTSAPASPASRVSPAQSNTGAQTAAARYNWGKPYLTDNFTGSRVSSKWELYNDPGNPKPGGERTKRSPKQVKVHGGILTITGKANGTSGGMAWLAGHQKYGRWEARVRMTRGCVCYHPVLLVENTGNPTTNEIDYLEVDHSANRSNADFNLHWGKSDHKLSANVKADLTRWHTFAVEVAPGHISGYLDGKRWFYTTNKAAIPNKQIGATIQLDWFPSEGAGTGATMQVDWIRMYKL